MGVIDEIKDYIYYIEELADNGELSLEHASFARTAAYRIIELLEQSPNKSPYDIIEEFRNDMYIYACSNNSFVFSIAIDVANDLETRFTDYI